MIKKNAHDEHLDILIADPSLIGLENVVLLSREEPIKKGKNVICEPDLVFEPIDDETKVIIVEYKNGYNNSQMKKQLRRARSHYRRKGLTVSIL